MRQRAPLSYITAYLQFTIAVIFMIGYFGFLYVLFTGRAVIAADLIELGKTLAIGLSGALGLLFAFLYLRSRVDSQPDPATTTIKQTTETETLPSIKREPAEATQVNHEDQTINRPAAATDPDGLRLARP
jgi:hypothetical protein